QDAALVELLLLGADVGRAELGLLREAALELGEPVLAPGRPVQDLDALALPPAVRRRRARALAPRLAQGRTVPRPAAGHGRREGQTGEQHLPSCRHVPTLRGARSDIMSRAAVARTRARRSGPRARCSKALSKSANASIFAPMRTRAAVTRARANRDCV